MKSNVNILAWLEATRPKTLAASIVPVGIASSLASTRTDINWLHFSIILICAILIQIITNYINEIFDFKRGADSGNRLGPTRQVAAGKISAKAMTIVSVALILLTFSLGMVLVLHSGLIILIIGILSLFFAFAYTGGPYPLAYNGLGDIFVFIFFGLVAVCGTFYVLTGQLELVAVLAAIPPGLLSANILSVNNIRDIETDKLAGKNTLAVKIGRDKSILIYRLLLILSFLVCMAIAILENNIWAMLPLMALPLAFELFDHIGKKSGKDLNNVLANTGKLLFIYGILLSIAFII